MPLLLWQVPLFLCKKCPSPFDNLISAPSLVNDPFQVRVETSFGFRYVPPSPPINAPLKSDRCPFLLTNAHFPLLQVPLFHSPKCPFSYLGIAPFQMR